MEGDVIFQGGEGREATEICVGGIRSSILDDQ